MSKYDALGDYLGKQKSTRVTMSFSEIERITGGKLPASQRHPAWWSNNPMTKVWLDAGFQTEQVDIAARKLVFRKGSAPLARETTFGLSGYSSAKKGNVGEHPVFARMRGTAQIPDGIDLTDPADPDWGDLVYGSDTAKKRA